MISDQQHKCEKGAKFGTKELRSKRIPAKFHSSCFSIKPGRIKLVIVLLVVAYLFEMNKEQLLGRRATGMLVVFLDVFLEWF